MIKYDLTKNTSLQLMTLMKWIYTLLLLYIVVAKTLHVAQGFYHEVRPGLSILSCFDTIIIITEQKDSL